jgi:hypothetical protein
LPSATINFSETTKYFELIATGQLLYIREPPGAEDKSR